MLGSFALQPVGFLVVGLATDRIGAGWVFIAAGLLNGLLTGIALSFRGVRQLQ
jgi:hypothetical protein